MKKLISIGCIMIIATCALAQTAPIMFGVFVDNVKPSMDANYREALKKLKSVCQQNKTNVNWNSVGFDDNSYAHLVPMKSFSDLDKNPWTELSAKIGKEAMANLWADLDKCVDEHSSYMMTKMPDLSYLAPVEGENYRDILFWYAESGKEAEAEKIIAEWKNLYESKKAAGGVITYKVIFGREPGYAIVSWGKNEADLAAKNQKNNELFGEEAGKLWAKTMLITKKYYSKRAWVMPDFSYTVAVAAK
jgi:predicted CopG family antitoxin